MPLSSSSIACILVHPFRATQNGLLQLCSARQRRRTDDEHAPLLAVATFFEKKERSLPLEVKKLEESQDLEEPETSFSVCTYY